MTTTEGREDPDAPALPPPGRRGATVVPESVVARIAVRATREAVARQTGTPDGPGGSARATATVHDGSARLGLTADLPYPVDIARTTGGIRRYVAERVGRLTGLRVDDVGLSVAHLVPDRTGRVR